ncbi:hypothetical protein RhiirA5_419563 [Rhizophagus irregularis]|uniref:Uncharacterized protein n=1 Tax=Rhizophagus irregularis TaxID=588596 RepID=A0A2N0PHX9_9GLOM|nr:hypothetical protein RhiirA5_437396 [Rhizophagus irregularis]PKC06434.1 hypothetical protein RhiirA5_419563 [Rhizophagus irregularis]PKK63335.1 hypothetical protein RhiirC2_717058 [Rhizophagus irregularis]
MSEYASYFNQDSAKWSLVSFDSWCLQKTNGCHANKIHRIFYKHMNDVLLKDSSTEQERSQARNLINSRKEHVKLANALWDNPDVLKSIYKENSKKRDRDTDEEDLVEKERHLALKERELSIKEREVKIRALELSNIEKEKELGL